jgi:hypothetical protein
LVQSTYALALWGNQFHKENCAIFTSTHIKELCHTFLLVLYTVHLKD